MGAVIDTNTSDVGSEEVKISKNVSPPINTERLLTEAEMVPRSTLETWKRLGVATTPAHIGSALSTAAN
jgi:hypothetical protein